ncbi:hypothetical protein Sviol_55050 [Streptomyces violascens]|uniref:Uncharacterized protein n=1 Tax=Streptomyces violascens TaxID=67381 RepID=A0ABQ3QUY8_9ACTN|nr:hypothetical protein Sviol_55050 [Streptomyces violascens]
MHARFEPLPAQRRAQNALDTAQALRERAGEWAHIASTENLNRATNLGHRIRSGKHTAFRPAGAFEAKARSTDDGTANVYARYVGHASSAQLPGSPPTSRAHSLQAP